jgi:hypothetical protein
MFTDQEIAESYLSEIVEKLLMINYSAKIQSRFDFTADDEEDVNEWQHN